MREFCLQRTRHVSLCEALDRILNTGVVALGEVTLSVADVDLIYLGLQLVITSVESGRELAPAGAGPQSAPDLPPRLMADEPAGPAPAGATGEQAVRQSSEVGTPRCGVRSAQRADPANPLTPATDASREKTEPNAGPGAEAGREKNGLGRLVLTLMKVLHELLKRQALRRIEGGALTSAQVERLGVTLMNQAREIDRLRDSFGLPDEDLNLDLGPLGKLL